VLVVLRCHIIAKKKCHFSFECKKNQIKGIIIFFCNLFGVPHLAIYILFPLINEPGLGAGIDPGMDFTPFPSSIA